MMDALSRRGPDGAGLSTWQGVVLGHRRLAIFDLSDAGAQPMLTPDGSVGVVFNGAIYNFHRLRAELERDGATFRSRTDTEVLLHGYRAWGIDGLVDRLRGMFAFGLWDADRDTLFLVRDRLGVKPLAFEITADGALIFASTVRAVHRGGSSRSLNEMAIAELFEYGYITEQQAIYEGIRKVPPATIVEWTRGELSMRTYWRTPAAGSSGAIAFEDAVHETERLLLAAVESRLQADVPIGALLSGGIDSALVCWAIKQLSGDVTAFTVGTPGHPSDETEAARATAAEIGIPHVVKAISLRDPDLLTQLVEAYPEPFGCGSALGMLRVSRAVRQSATVLLTGDGGDDIFLGYERHRMMFRLAAIARHIPQGAASAWYAARRFGPRGGVTKRLRHAIDYATGGLGAFLSATPGLPELRRLGVLGERLASTEVETRRIAWSVQSARQLLRDYQAHDFAHQFVSEYLAKVDGATMYWGLEARSPFLDQELWQFAASLPHEIRLHQGELKAILREIVRRRISPRAAAERKRGFTVPVETWMQGALGDELARLLEDSHLHAGGWIDAPRTRTLLRSQAVSHDLALQLWYILVAERWMRTEAGIPAPAVTAGAGDSLGQLSVASA